QDRHVMGKGSEVPLLVSDKSDKDLASGYAWSRNLYAIGAAVSLLFLIPVGIFAVIFIGAFAAADHAHQNLHQQANAQQPNNPWPPNQQPVVNKQPIIPPFEDDRQKPPPPPPLAPVDYVVQALNDVRGNDRDRRADALRRLERAPDDAKQ